MITPASPTEAMATFPACHILTSTVLLYAGVTFWAFFGVDLYPLGRFCLTKVVRFPSF